MTTVRDRLIPLAEVAEMLGVERETLWSWRHREEGPASFKIGDKVVYRESELLAWIEAQESATRKGGATNGAGTERDHPSAPAAPSIRRAPRRGPPT